MIETKKQREKRQKAEAPVRAKRAADYARKMSEPIHATVTESEAIEQARKALGPVHAAFVKSLDKDLASVCPHCGGAI